MSPGKVTSLSPTSEKSGRNFVSWWEISGCAWKNDFFFQRISHQICKTWECLQAECLRFLYWLKKTLNYTLELAVLKNRTRECIHIMLKLQTHNFCKIWRTRRSWSSQLIVTLSNPWTGAILWIFSYGLKGQATECVSRSWWWDISLLKGGRISAN